LTRVRLTRDGIAFAVALVLLLLVALGSGNNMLYLLVSAGLAVALVELVVGGWNLRSLTLRRKLPEELFAAKTGNGEFIILNRRRFLPAVALHIHELDDGDAVATVDRVASSDASSSRTKWRFENRGLAQLGRVSLSSSFPFGLLLHYREVTLNADLFIYPKPLFGSEAGSAGEAGRCHMSPRQVGGLGDFAGLRAYLPTDPLRAIHWPTSARADMPIVVLRTDEVGEEVMVRVELCSDEEWELELRRACGEILRAFDQGSRVGLEMPDVVHPCHRGMHWRRHLLDVLAQALRRGERW
jgi:uncharacterized protein (DUF58 family)